MDHGHKFTTSNIMNILANLQQIMGQLYPFHDIFIPCINIQVISVDFISALDLEDSFGCVINPSKLRFWYPKSCHMQVQIVMLRTCNLQSSKMIYLVSVSSLHHMHLIPPILICQRNSSFKLTSVTSVHLPAASPTYYLYPLLLPTAPHLLSSISRLHHCAPVCKMATYFSGSHCLPALCPCHTILDLFLESLECPSEQ